MIIGTAGHIDHGKSTLIRALSGVETDRLKAEKQRGISIELGYAYMPLANDDVLGFVDVPGHEKLVRMMVAGAGGIDHALLVIAADDGIMPQTREHLAIVQLLGITQATVALTKIDRVDSARVKTVSQQIQALLAPTRLQGAPIFPVNAHDKTAAGTQQLRDHLLATARQMPAHTTDNLFRLAVDRVFSLPGRGTIATGTVFAGQVQINDQIQIMPAGKTARVRSIHAQDQAANIGQAGQRCALNLAGINHDELTRGDWLAAPGALMATRRLDTHLHYLASNTASLANGSPVHVHIGTSHQVARLVLLAGNRFQPGTDARAQLVFETPLCALPGDRLILRDAQAAHTIGGGHVLDPCGAARHRRSAARHAWLDAIQDWLTHGDLTPLLNQAPRGLALDTLARLTNRPTRQLQLPANAITIGHAGDEIIWAAGPWQTLQTKVLDILRDYHASHPEEPGVEPGRLRRMTDPGLDTSVWQHLIQKLLDQQAIRRDGPWLRLPEHHIEFSSAEQQQAEQLLTQLQAAGWTPLWVRDLAAQLAWDETTTRNLLNKMATAGQVHQIVRDLFLHPDAAQQLAQRFAQLATQQGQVRTATFRDAIGLGRKRTIQILEYFDRAGLTRRIGKQRMLRPDSDWLQLTL